MVSIAEFSLGNIDEEGLASIIEGAEVIVETTPAYNATLATVFSRTKVIGET